MKKQYQSPTIKVVKVKAQQIICTSKLNEQYEEIGPEKTGEWFN